MPAGVATGHHNLLGDLVPRLVKGRSNHVLEGCLKALITQHADPLTVDASGWHSESTLTLPWEPACEPSHTCVVQLTATAVGVVKVSKSGDCTVFVRLKATDLAGWAKARKVELRAGTLPRVFWCELRNTVGHGLLKGNNVVCLKGDEVHHPHALSILCNMSLAGWLKPSASNEAPARAGKVRLVALPHIDVNLEQCLCLMGWKATFSKDNLNTSLLQKVKVDGGVWGKTYDAMTNKETAEKMGRAAKELRNYADPSVFTKLIPALNKHALGCKKVLDTMSGMVLRAKEPEAGPSQRNGHRPPPAAAGAQMAVSDDDQSDSDSDSDSDNDDAPAAPAPAPAPAPASASARRPAPEPTAAPLTKRPRKRSSSDDSDSDSESAVHKEDADLSRVVHTSDEEDSSSSSSSSSESGDDDSDASAASAADAAEAAEAAPAPPPSPPPAPAARVAPASNTPVPDRLAVARNREEHVVALAAAAARETILDTFKEQAAPCCEQMRDWMRAHQLTTNQERMHAIHRDVERLQRGDSAAGMMAAALRLVEALAGTHTDRQTGDTVPINVEVQRRASAAVYKAKEFTATTLEQVEDMIGQLKHIHQQGCGVQECVGQVAAGAGPSAHRSA